MKLTEHTTRFRDSFLQSEPLVAPQVRACAVIYIYHNLLRRWKTNRKKQIMVVLGLLTLCNLVLAVNDPIAHWKFDEGSGGIAYDSAGSNNGAITGAAWFSDPCRGMCLSFNGSGDYVNVENTVTHNLAKGTFTAWVNPTSLSSVCGGYNFAYIIGANNYTGGEFGFRVNGDGSGWASVRNNVTNGYLSFPAGSITVGSWYLVAMTWDGSYWKLYINGVQKDSKSFSQGTSNASNTALIGKGWDGCSWNGKIDDVRFYNRALSVGEIQQLYQYGEIHTAFNPHPANGATGVDPDIVLSWWPGCGAASHDVYFGTSYNSVNDADIGSPEYKGNFDVNSFDPYGLDFSTTYYWRIDEVNGPDLWKGDVWSFETVRPTIALSAMQIEFYATEGGTNPADQILGISDSSAGTLNWQINEDCDWLFAEPNSGSSTGEVDNVNLSVDISGLAAGKYTCNLTVSDVNASNNPQTVGVTLHVRDADGILYVPLEYSTIQAAIDVSVNGDTVIVAPGTYTGPGNRDIDFLGKAITVRSEIGPENCIIDCNGTRYEPHRGFYLHNNEDANSILDGFTVTNGWSEYGGGIACIDSNVTISNCIIKGNYTQGCGSSGGGIGCGRSSSIIRNCDIMGNWAFDYAGGGINCGGGSPTIINCRIVGNFGRYGGGIASCWDSNPVTTGCTIAGNYAINGGGGIYCDDSNLKITNSILWDNEALDGSQICLDYDGNTSVIFTDVQGGQDDVFVGSHSFLNWGPGNVDIDPYFVKPGYWDTNGAPKSYEDYLWIDGDYRLLCNSSCIDVGYPNYITEPDETDLDGNPRIIGERIDMGAYEYNPNTLTVVVSPTSLSFFQEPAELGQQTLFIRRCGNEPLYWEITEDCNWLQVSPTSGILTDQINEVTIAVDPNGLAPAVYTCSFEVRASNAYNSPVTVWVNMVVRGILRIPRDFSTIQDAIDAANNYDIVLVADGLYTGQGNHDIDFKGKPLIVRSENGPNNCIINCQNANYGFYLQNGEKENSVIDGFTINDAARSGIHCYKSSSTIRNCIITGNPAGMGGVFCESREWFVTSPIISNCLISDNNSIGILCYWSSPTISHCKITGNSFTGIECDYSSPTIINCTVFDNSMGGICCQGYNKYVASPIISNCIISENNGVGIECVYSNPTISYCTITGNSEGGVHRCGGPITNCIIAGNKAVLFRGTAGLFNCDGPITSCIVTGNSATNSYSHGGGMEDCDGPVTNCIIWNNVSADGSQLCDSAEPTYSCIQDWTGGGLGNIDADPCFVEPGYWDTNDTPADSNDDFWVDGDYHLKSEGWRWDSVRSRWDYDDVTSRCIDAGNPGSPLGDELLSMPDDPNNEWGENLRINMGAFGGTAEASIPPYDWAILSDVTNDGISDFSDIDILSSLWLNTREQLYADFNQDGIIDLFDFALLAQDWLKQTTWYE